MLLPGHHKAVGFYLSGMSEYAAMKKAGYKETYARKMPHKIFRRKDVKKEIKKRMKAMAKRVDINSEWILQQLKNIVSADIGDILVIDEEGRETLDLSKLTPELRAGLSGELAVEYEGHARKKKVKIKQVDRLKALEMLMRALGMFEDKIVVAGEISLIERLQRGRARAGLKENEDV